MIGGSILGDYRFGQSITVNGDRASLLIELCLE